MVPPGPLTKHQQQQTNKHQPTARGTPARPTTLQFHPRRKPNTPPAPTRLNGRGQGFWSGFERSEARKKPWPRPKAEPPQKQSQPPPKAKLPQKQRRRPLSKQKHEKKPPPNKARAHHNKTTKKLKYRPSACISPPCSPQAPDRNPHAPYQTA